MNIEKIMEVLIGLLAEQEKAEIEYTKRENRVSGRKEGQAWKSLNYRQCRSWS